LALAGNNEDQAFAPEPFSLLYQRSLYQSMHTLTKRVFQLLRKNMETVPKDLEEDAYSILQREKDILDRLWEIRQEKMASIKIRIHGDFHLGQVLYTGKDFVIIDFEGEPMRTLGERRLKRSPIRDLAGMIRSFHYASHSSLLDEATLHGKSIETLEPWAELWRRIAVGSFVRGYLQEAGHTVLIPQSKKQFNILLRTFLMEKAIYELGYEMNNRPQLISVPLKGLKHLLETQ
jgi:maltose alpha-D-glucosyltransferase/alpha-amylase